VFKPKLLSYWLAISLFVVLYTVPLFFIHQVQPDNRAEVFFPEDAPVRILENELRKQFPEDDVLIVLFSGDNLYSDSFVERFEEVVNTLESNPLIERVVSMTTMEHIKGTEDGFVVEFLLKLDEIGALDEAQRKQRILKDRFAPNRIVSQDGNYLAMIIRPVPLENSFASAAIRTSVQDLIDENNLSEQVVATAGNIEIEVAMFDMMLSDNMRFVPATVLLGIILLWWMFRRVIVIVLVLLSIGVAINNALLLVAFLEQPLSMPVSMVISLLTSLTIAFYIHFFNSFLQATLHGYSGKLRIEKVLDDVERPIRYSALTTMAGFLSLGFSPLPPIKTFGFAAAFGVGILYIVIIWIIPAILYRWDNKKWSVKSSGMARFNRFIRYVSRISIRNAGLVVVVTIFLLVLGVSQIMKVKAETDLLLYFPEEHSLSVSDRLIASNLAGTVPLEIVFDGDKRDSLKEAEFLKELKQIQNWVEAMPEVDITLSMADIVEEMHWAFHGEDAAYHVVPDNRAIISQYLFIYDGRDLYDLVDSEFNRTRLQLNLNVHGARKIRKTMNTIEQYMEREHKNLNWQFAGAARLFSDHEKLLIEGQLKSGLAAFSIIFLCLFLFWRSFLPALLAMLPNISPIIFIFITMGILGITLDIGTAIVLSVAIGIAVDDTVHLYDSYLRRVKKGVKPLIALVRSYQTTGRAIVATTIILCGQFFFLALSSFVPTYQFGLMTGIGLLAALFFDIFFLPAVLALGMLRRKQKMSNKELS